MLSDEVESVPRRKMDDDKKGRAAIIPLIPFQLSFSRPFLIP